MIVLSMAAKRGRSLKKVEFYRKLHELSGFETKNEFARASGRKLQDVSSYLSGFKVPGDKVLRSSLRHLHEWAILPLSEINPIPEKLNDLPTDPGVYVIYDSGGNVLYLGQATSFRAELRQTLNRRVPRAVRLGPNLGKKQPLIGELAKYLSLYKIPSERARHNVEALLLRIFANQTHNTNVGHFWN
jgi:hypothetical protein